MTSFRLLWEVDKILSYLKDGNTMVSGTDCVLSCWLLRFPQPSVGSLRVAFSPYFTVTFGVFRYMCFAVLKQSVEGREVNSLRMGDAPVVGWNLSCRCSC